jgi:hypothetical protein
MPSPRNDLPYTLTTQAQVDYLRSVDSEWVRRHSVRVGYTMSGLRQDVADRVRALANPNYRQEIPKFTKWWNIEGVNLPD